MAEGFRPVAAKKPGLMPTLAACYYCATFGGALWLFLGSLALCWFRPWFCLVYFPLLAFTFGPGAHASSEGDWPTPMRNWALSRTLADYFDARIVKTADLQPAKPHIFVLHPHGVLTFSAWLGFCTNALGFNKLFPGVDLRVLTVSINFKTPLFREYLLAHGICDVSQRSCLRILGKAKSVLIAVGGAAESLLARPGANELVLRRRKGFIKIALLSGASLVPVYCFGECNTFDTLNSLPRHSLLRRMQRWMQRSWGWTIPIWWGRWGFLPYPVQLRIVTGAPILVEKFEGDHHTAQFAALVDKYHAQYTAALTKLFNEHKEEFAPGEDDLRIVE